jgi:Lipocalin-like domain
MATESVTTDARTQLVGTWKLKSNIMEHKNTGERHLVHGEHPNGYLIFTPEGRMMGILQESGREPPRDDADRMRLFKILVAYSGIYHVEGDKFITKVDVSWNKWWNGQEHARHFKITGDELEIVTAWEPVRPVLGSPLVRTFAVWERAV